MTSNPGLARVNEHSLPYRVLVDEIRERRPEVLEGKNVDTLLAAVDEAHRKIEEFQGKEDPDMGEYRALQMGCAQAEKPLKDILHEAKLSALCFSGGGIRSASFGLGVLTGLAQLSVGSLTPGKPKRGILEDIDYVSTVSGGGYIGSWLTGWIREHPEGFKGILRDLAAFRLTSADPEAGPVRHLRDYTSYLAPSGGMLSPDSWTLAAIFLRNLLLNWAILVPTFAALLLLPLLNTYTFTWARKLDANLLLGSAAGFAFLALLCTGLNLPGNYKLQARRSRKANFIWVIVPILLSAWCLSVGFLAALDFGTNFDSWRLFRQLWLMSAIAHAALFLVRRWAARKGHGRAAEMMPDRPFFWGQIFALAGASAFAAWILWLFAEHVGKHLVSPGAEDIRLFTSLSVPLVLGAFCLTAVLLNGLSAKFDLEEDREWWSRSGAFVLMCIVMWPVAHLIVLYNREITAAAEAVFLGKVSGSVSMPALTALIGTIASWIGFSPATPSGQAKIDPQKLGKIRQFLTKRDLLTTVLGIAFFVFLAIALAQANDWLFRWIGRTLYAQEVSLCGILVEFAGVVLLAVVMNLFVNVNTFSLHGMYRSRLVRSYLGASNNKRRPNPFTNFDPNDNFALTKALEKDLYKAKKTTADAPKADVAVTNIKNAEVAPANTNKTDGPMQIINIALNVVATKNLAWQQRKAESFTASALHCGSFRVGYQPTKKYAGEDGITLGTAMAISGAAASPNMGYHSSPILTLVMTFFNARLGWWLPNPGIHGEGLWQKISPRFSLLPL
ncbi:MAG TPA: hypothetical protein VGJ30_14135, partial [Candidatus Angelobacter sp.]